MSIEQEKQFAAEAAADLVEHGMSVGLGTGSTVAFLLPALARRSPGILCAATSGRTEHAARELSLRIEDFASIDRFDVTIDGADQISPDGWLVKGGGLFPPEMMATVLVARGKSVDRIDLQRGTSGRPAQERK